ncbi:MAG: hypothetical protein KME50_26870 [Nostoc desertorum CM1-VF14]|jgi:hypothetical protein|nr:hypothetical protein [Nostoc desertorum CM1-VF14]
MDKLQKVKIALQESERWFRAIFKQTFGFIELIQLMDILIEGNQTALKFSEITSSKVIHCALWETCWSDFSGDVEDLSSIRVEALNFRPTFVEKLVQSLDVLLLFPHNVKIQAQWWAILKEIQAQLQKVITRASTIWKHRSQVKSFSNQSQKLIFLIPKGLTRLGILSRVHKKGLVFSQTVEHWNRQ